MWNIHKSGFLPLDPIEELHPAMSVSKTVERLARDLPVFVANNTVRKDLVDGLRGISKIDMTDFIDSVRLLPEQAERGMMLFSYFASSYIHSPGEPTAKLLPKEIAKPLVDLSNIVSRPPILSYASYCLCNWRRSDYEKPIELGNIELLQNFTLSEGRRDENWFILVHVDIEAKAAKAISVIKELLSFWLKDDAIGPLLDELYISLSDMYITLCRMPEECSTDIYFSKVRPYIFSYENIVYEDIYDRPITYRGETGAQSSCIPAIQLALGIKHKDSLLTKHLEDMRKYMPIEHRMWLNSVERTVSFRDHAIRLGLKEQYNKCVEKLIDFRSKHLQYAIDYIQKKVDNPVGTGGTPYIKWLSQLVDETKEFLIID